MVCIQNVFIVYVAEMQCYLGLSECLMPIES